MNHNKLKFNNELGILFKASKFSEALKKIEKSEFKYDPDYYEIKNFALEMEKSNQEECKNFFKTWPKKA